MRLLARRLGLFAVVILFCGGISNAEPQSQTIIVDAYQNCIDLARSGQDVRDAVIKRSLKPSTHYTVRLEGQAWHSPETGQQADPIEGVVVYYEDDTQDGLGARIRVLKPGESFSFTSTKYHQKYFIAFMFDPYGRKGNSRNHGSFQLILTAE